MSETKHTPGPWVVVTDESAAQVKGYPCIYADGYTVVGTEGMFGDIETDFANAHLIAAAPDLLDALECLLSELDFTETYPFPSEKKCKAAIAKAKGETK